MAKIDPTPGEFRTWVEVFVEDATLEDDLNERVRRLAETRGVEALKAADHVAQKPNRIDVAGVERDPGKRPAWLVLPHPLSEQHGLAAFGRAEIGNAKRIISQHHSDHRA